jgi:hypothetical protein
LDRRSDRRKAARVDEPRRRVERRRTRWRDRALAEHRLQHGHRQLRVITDEALRLLPEDSQLELAAALLRTLDELFVLWHDAEQRSRLVCRRRMVTAERNSLRPRRQVSPPNGRSWATSSHYMECRQANPDPIRGHGSHQSLATGRGAAAILHNHREARQSAST